MYRAIEDRYEYDAFGTPYKGDFSNGLDGGYTGKPYDATTGLYNYGYRDYSPETARFTTVDPIRDGSNWFSYVVNDPVNYVDLWGLAPGDVFASPDDASEDFGRIYNPKSIDENAEYGTTIIEKDDGYTYLPPNKGSPDYVPLPLPEGGEDDVVAASHTHGSHLPSYGKGNEDFSETDKKLAEDKSKPFYVTTPGGVHKVYDPNAPAGEEERVIHTDMPRDPNSPYNVPVPSKGD